MKPPVLLAVEVLGTTTGARRGLRRSKAELLFHQNLFPSKIRWNTNQTRELSVMVCTRTEGFAPHNVGKKGVWEHGYFTAWWPSIATNISIVKQLFCSGWKQWNCSFFSQQLQMKSYLRFFLIVMCFPATFCMVCFGRELQHSDCLVLFSDLSLAPWDLPFPSSPVSVWIFSSARAGQTHISYSS